MTQSDRADDVIDGGTIQFRRRGAGENLRVDVTESEVRVAHGAGLTHRVYSSVDERMSLAAWVGSAEFPATPSEVASPVDSIQTRHGAQE